jgi:4-amino-4-deoxy-L-arabinose transferase-like glycosyltransferase
MPGPQAFSRSAFSRTALWQPIHAAWGWLAPFGAKALPRRSYLALALLSLVLILPGEFSIPATDRDESRYAQATKQMMESGDFLDIRLGDVPRYVQPAGIYWLQAIATAPFGGPGAQIWAYRLPSILAALASVLVLAWFGTRIASPAVGVAGALLLATSVLFAIEAHIAKIDATLLLSVIVAQGSLYLSLEGKERGRFIGWPLAFWAALGAGTLLKGPIILAVVGLTALVYAYWNRNFKMLLRLRPLLGVAVLIALVAPWLIAITLKTKGEFLSVAIGQSIGGKLAGTSDRHAGLPGYHTILFMLTFFPGIVLAGLGGAYAWFHRKDRLARFLIAWAVPTWLLFEIVPTKLPHYILPTLPAIALLVALSLKEGRALLSTQAARWAHRVTGILFVIAALVLAALPFAASKVLGLPSQLPSFVAAAGVFAVLLAGASLWMRPAGERLLPLLAAMALSYFTLFELVTPALDPLWASQRIAQRLKGLSGCDRIEVATAGFAEPSNLFHFGARTFFGSGETSAQYLSEHPMCGVALVESAERATFDAAAADLGLRLTSLGEVAGFNYVRGQAINLEILLPANSRLRPTAPGPN